MMNWKLLALLGLVSVLGMSGCGKKKHNRRNQDRRTMVRKDHRRTNKKAKKQTRRNRRNERREERNMYAK